MFTCVHDDHRYRSVRSSRKELEINEMSYAEDFNVFVGGRSGVFKGVKVSRQVCVMKNIQSLMAITRDHEITTMAWGDEGEKDILIGCGAKGVRSVKIYDTDHSTFTSSFNSDVGTGTIRGISRYHESVLTAVESGHVKLWRYDGDEQVLINAGERLHRMRHSAVQKNIIATGGRENELKLFDLETQAKVFTEKNVAHDFLELRVPIWVSDISFLPNSNLICTCSKYGYVRLYDPSAQRRPVINLQVEDEALTTMTVAPRERHIVVASGKGKMNLIDLRNPGKILNTYKGFVGGITDLACSKTEPLIVSVGLDRYMRIHHLDTKRLVQQVYLVSSLNAILLRSDFCLNATDEMNRENIDDSAREHVGHEKSKSLERDDVCLDSDAEYETIFNQMTVIDNERNEADLPMNKRRVADKSAIVEDSNLESLDNGKSKRSLTPKKLKKKMKFR